MTKADKITKHLTKFKMKTKKILVLGTTFFNRKTFNES